MEVLLKKHNTISLLFISKNVARKFHYSFCTGVMANLYEHVVMGQMSCQEELKNHWDILDAEIFLSKISIHVCVEIHKKMKKRN